MAYCPECAERDKEIARLCGIANNRICSVCLERHNIDVMCPPFEVRTTGQQWFRAELYERNKRIDALAGHVKKLWLTEQRERKVLRQIQRLCWGCARADCVQRVALIDICKAALKQETESEDDDGMRFGNE